MKSLTLHIRLITCILSLLLAAALLPLWYRSHQGPEFVKYASPNHWYLSLTSGHGTVDILYIAHWPGEPEFLTGRRDPQVMYATRYGKRFLGFGSAAQTNGGRFVVIPYWFLVTCCILAPSSHPARRTLQTVRLRHARHAAALSGMWDGVMNGETNAIVQRAKPPPRGGAPRLASRGRAPARRLLVRGNDPLI